MRKKKNWEHFLHKRLTRRKMLGASAKVGVGAAGLALVGCGPNDTDQKQTTRKINQIAKTESEETHRAEKPKLNGRKSEEESTKLKIIKRGGTMRQTLAGLSSGNPPTFDPFSNLTYLAQIPGSYHFSRLLRTTTGAEIDYDDFATLEPDAASSLPEIVDPQTYIYTLRKNLKFHDIAPTNGRSVQASDVAASESRFREVSPNRGSWITAVDNLQIINESTFRLNLSIPFAPMAGLTASPEHLWIIPQEIVDDNSVESRPIGSGPWIFDEFIPDVEIRWRRNPDWYLQGFPLMDECIISLVSDPSTIISNLSAGELDASIISGLPWRDVIQTSLADLQHRVGGDNVFGGIYFDYGKKPWGDVRVRQALSMAMDRDGILDVTDQTGQRLWQTAIPTIRPYSISPLDDEFGPNAKYFKRDVQAAIQLLDAAGYPEGIELRAITSPVYGPAFGQRMELVLSTIADAGFRGEIENVEYANYITTIYSGSFPNDASGIAMAPLKGNSYDPDDVYFTNYHPLSARHNWGAGPGDPSGDHALLSLWNEQRMEQDFETRVELNKEIQRVMAESMYIVPWPGQSSIWAGNPNIQNFFPRAGYGNGVEYLPFAWLDD